MTNAHNIILYLSDKYKGDWGKIYNAIRNREKFETDEVEKIACKYKNKCKTVALTDPDYPPALKKMERPPFLLYCSGDLNLLRDESRCVAYVGSREASSYGRRMASSICEKLARDGYIVISGMAKGIDAEAQNSALDAGGISVAILGNGMDICYPLENKELYDKLKLNGLLISEYPPGTKPSKDNFPLRNRIIAALSRLIIVGEANMHSGTLITINYALEFGKDVACIPYHADEDSACNLLIRDGASIINSYDDVKQLLF